MNNITENTPSFSQYFSWINNTNEGSTEKHTLINLEFFKWIRKEYGMILDIYAFDAGNLDGAGGTYETFDSPKLKKQFPEGLKNIAEETRKMNCKLGIWGGADGYGNTDEEMQKRRELLVSLCRDYNMGLFKFDTVCGALRAEKRQCFAQTMDECRKYCPQLVVLNHRNDFGEVENQATTFLWGGEETYIDAFLLNKMTALHHRATAMSRGRVPQLKRLTEDHGVCLSSCLDYFDDDIVMQAFNRSLILSPELYGNPWFLRDDEFPVLARLFNIHRDFGDILVNGIELDEKKCGFSAVSRGNGRTRLLSSANISWKTFKAEICLDKSIGLEKSKGKINLIRLHPTEKLLGQYEYGDTVSVNIDAFRSLLLLISYDTDEKYINGYENLGRESYEPKMLCSLEKCDVPKNSDEMYEYLCFSADNDSLEARSVKRSGETKIKEVKDARDAFFAQERYYLRGCESKFAFDGKDETLFDGRSVDWVRIDGGCLRADFGKAFDAKRLEIEYFEIDEPIKENSAQPVFSDGEFSDCLCSFKSAPIVKKSEREVTETVIRMKVHDLLNVKGKRVTVTFEINGKIRFFKLATPPYKIHAIRLFDDDGEIDLKGAKATNLFAPTFKAEKAYSRSIVLKNIEKGMYLSIAVEGKHGKEGAYPAVFDKTKGEFLAVTDRATSFPFNPWEYCSPEGREEGYTYFVPITEESENHELEVTVLLKGSAMETGCDVYLCK